MKIKLTELESLCLKALEKYGYDDAESKTILGMLMYAQTRGNNQGIVKLIGRGIPKSEKAQAPTVEKETPTTAIINANATMEAIAMEQAVAMAVDKAKQNGIAIVGVRNGAGSSGAIGYWSRKVAEQGMVGITMSSYPLACVPAHGSYEPLFCTNPIAWGVPSKGEPIVLDMASSVIAWYGLVEAKTKGAQLPARLGYDKEGNETADPDKIMAGGALKSFDNGYKGAGLALMVQVIGGALVGADFLNRSDNNGNVVIAINPDALAGTDYLLSEVEKMKQAMKASKRLPGVDEVLVPGERGDRVRESILKSGEIEVEDNLLSELKKFVGQASQQY